MIERSDDDLVALAQRPPERAGEEEVQRGHALAEGGLARRAAEERRRRARARSATSSSVRQARLVRGADVGVVLAQVARDGVDDLVRALRAARPVEEREAPVERGEARAHCGDVEKRGTHEVTSWPLTIQSMPRSRDQRVGNEAAVLGLREELLHGLRGRVRCKLDGELRLDVDEGVEPVAGAPRHRSVCGARSRDVEPGAMCGMVHARERAAEETGEHEVLRPPLRLPGERRPTERAPRRAVRSTLTSNSEHAGANGHGAEPR